VPALQQPAQAPSTALNQLNTDNGGYGGGGGFGYGAEWQPNNTVVATSGSVQCGGDITATFTWHEDDGQGSEDTPPQAVVIAETCAAQWFSWGDVAAMPTGGSSNGLGFPYVSLEPMVFGTYYWGLEGHSEGTRYKVKQNPGTSFSITCSPHVQVAGTGVVGPPQAGGVLNGSVSYQANTEPLEVILSGGIGPQDGKRYLIGQLVTATLSAGGLQPTSYSWSISGGEPFKYYTASSSEGKLLELKAEDMAGASLGFHFRKPPGSGNNGTATVSCQVHLATPPGALPVGGFDVTPSRDCGVEAPQFTFEAAVGTVQFDDEDNPTKFLLNGAQLLDENGNPVTRGSVWGGEVTTPAAFGSGGGWNFTQTVTPHRVIESLGETHNWSYNGKPGLDARFPAFPETQSGLYPADGSRQVDGDIPDQFIRPPFTRVEADDSLVAYMLYMPPGEGSAYVPLQIIMNWSWKGEASPNSSGGWTLSKTGKTGAYGEKFPLHPKWTHNNANGAFVPPLPPRP